MSSPKQPPQDLNNQNADARATQESDSLDNEYTPSEALKKAILKLKSQTMPQFDGSISDQVTEHLPSINPSDINSSSHDDDITLTRDKTLSLNDIEDLRQQVVQPRAASDEWELSAGQSNPSTTLVPKTDIPSTNTMTAREQTPWTLQQFFDGEIDLDIELSKRFPTMPLLSSVKFRSLGSRSGRKVATLDTADGSASLIIDADVESKVIQLSFTYGSMMTLRYSLLHLSDMDRSRWLELMRRDEGGLAFLWGPSRWQDDYLICIARKYATNIYAFSPNSFESAVRLTPQVTKQLIDWLDEVWKALTDEPSDDNPLLTW